MCPFLLSNNYSLLLYVCPGAYAFVAIEVGNENRQYEIKKEKAELVNQSADYLGHLFWAYAGQNRNYTNYSSQVMKMRVKH